MRQEIAALVASALFLLVLLSSFTLFAYRSSVIGLLDARRAEAEELARWITRTRLPAPGRTLEASELQRLAPNARAVRIVDSGGEVILGPPRSFDSEQGFDSGVVVGRAPFVRGDTTRWVEVELPSVLLLSRERSLRILTPVVLCVDVAVLLLMMLYVRRLLAPFDRLLDRARELGQVPEDEMAFFIDTFERTIERLAREEDDDLRTLEDLLGESLASGVLVCDAGGEVVALNPVGADLLGLDRDAALGRSILDLLEAGETELREHFRHLLHDERVLRREEISIGPADARRVLGLTAQPLRRDDGHTRGFLVLFADLTEVQRRLADERLSDGLKQLGELTAGVAHEMRNGLSTLKGYLALVERSEDPAAIRDFVSEIRQETEHLRRVLEDFLSFARPGRSRLERIDLVGVLHRVAADPGLDGEIRLAAISPAPLEVSGDPALLGRAFSNLVQNALAAQARAASEEVDEVSPVEIRAGLADGGVRVEILDRGSGLPPELRGRLFDPFVSGRSDGVGLGLALTRRIVLLHGGRVTLEDRRDGVGARAVVWLPTPLDEPSLGTNVTKSNRRHVDSPGVE